MANTVSKERMFVVLNEQFVPPKEFNEKRLTFTDPVETTLHDRNTLVTISGIPGKGYYGDVDVYYDRMNVADYAGAFDFRSLNVLDRNSVVTALANRYQIDIKPLDFTDFIVPPLGDGESADIEIFIDPTSLQWYGSLDLHLEYGKSWLDMVVGARKLDIYKIPNALTNRINGRMTTWGMDFSGAQFALKPTLNGDYTDWDTVKMVCNLLGIPEWLKGKVVDKATADVPDANPAFQRVVIQTTVVSGQLAGPMYFHYNPA